jgi:outer membrane protein assembly factor BamB
MESDAIAALPRFNDRLKLSASNPYFPPYNRALMELGRLSFLLCCAAALILGSQQTRADDWPQWLGPKRDGVWRESGILQKFPESGPPIRWRVAIGSGYTGPAVANSRVYVADRHVRKGSSKPSNSFDRSSIPGTERILCLDEKNGQVIWQHEYDCPYTMSYAAGPRATPLVSEGKVYTLGGEGNLLCLDAIGGKVFWSHDFKKDFGAKTPVWGFAAAPLLDVNRLICLVGAENGVAMAFDKDSGQELWRALSAKEPGYAPPTMIEAAAKLQLIIWHPEAVNALNPVTGQLYWKQSFNSPSGLSISTPRQMGDLLFFTSFYSGSLMLRLDDSQPRSSVVWRSKKASEKDTDALHSIISTPFLEDGYIYGVCSYGQLRCLKADTGERLWETLRATTSDGKETRWANAFLIKNGDRFFLPNEKGDLIIARLTPKGYDEISRTHLLDATNRDPGRDVVWSHPAFASRCVFARNDKEILCADLKE